MFFSAEMTVCPKSSGPAACTDGKMHPLKLSLHFNDFYNKMTTIKLFAAYFKGVGLVR